MIYNYLNLLYYTIFIQQNHYKTILVCTLILKKCELPNSFLKIINIIISDYKYSLSTSFWWANFLFHFLGGTQRCLVVYVIFISSCCIISLLGLLNTSCKKSLFWTRNIELSCTLLTGRGLVNSYGKVLSGW